MQTNAQKLHSWVVDELTLLFTSRGEVVTAERLDSNARDLMDISPAVLKSVLDRARRELKYMPNVPEIREMAGVLRSQLDAVEIDSAWTWVQDYIKKHDVDGRDHVVAADPEAWKSCEDCHGSGWRVLPKGDKSETARAVRCSCREATRTPAPKISPRTEYALRQLGTTLQGGLESVRDCESKYQGKVRKEFGEAYLRAQLSDFVKQQEQLPAPVDGKALAAGDV